MATLVGIRRVGDRVENLRFRQVLVPVRAAKRLSTLERLQLNVRGWPLGWRLKLLEEIPFRIETLGRANSSLGPAATPLRQVVPAQGDECPRVETAMAGDQVVMVAPVEDLLTAMVQETEEVHGAPTGLATFAGNRRARAKSQRRSRGWLRCRLRRLSTTER